MRIRSIEELWLSPEVKVNCFVEPSLLPTGGLMVVTGEPETGKSWMVQQGSFELATGSRLWGLFPAKQVKVIHLEIEKGTVLAEKRFKNKLWQESYPTAIGQLGYADEPFNIDTASGVKSLSMAIEDFEAKVIVVDSYSVSLDNEIELANQKKAIRAYRGIAKSKGCSFILIQHLIKRSTVFDKSDKEFYEPPLRLDDLRGSKFLEYEVDTVVGLVKGKNVGDRVVGFLKASYCPVPISEIGPIRFNLNPARSSPFRPDEGLLKVLEYLDLKGPCPMETLDINITLSRPTIIKSVNRLEELGLVIVHRGGGRGHETYVSPIK